MKNQDKSNEQLIGELKDLRKRIKELKKAVDYKRKIEKNYENLFQQIVDNSPNPIFSIDNKGLINLWNSACRNIFKHKDEIVGQHYNLILHSTNDFSKIVVNPPALLPGDGLASISAPSRAV